MNNTFNEENQFLNPSHEGFHVTVLSIGDIFLILVLLAGAFLVTLSQRLPHEKSEAPLKNEILCSVKGPDFEKKIDLKDYLINKKAREQKIQVKGKIGKTTIKIDNRGVCIESSCCKNKNCIHMGKVNRPGEFLLCAPNNVAVIIETKGPKEKGDLHGITY